MILESAGLIRDELSAYILNHKDQQDNISGRDIILGNIAALENDQTGDLNDKVIVSLVNIEEESAMKNGKTYLHDPGSKKVRYVLPSINLNMYLLFSATLSSNTNSYSFALHRLSLVVEFFQSRRFFSKFIPFPGLNGNDSGSEGEEPDGREVQIYADLYTLTFEQVNHLWGTLGGKQVPFVMYKMRLVEIDGQHRLRDGQLVERTQRETGVVN